MKPFFLSANSFNNEIIVSLSFIKIEELSFQFEIYYFKCIVSYFENLKKFVSIFKKFLMQTIVNSSNRLLPFGKKLKKYLPFFIGFKILTFTGFLTYLMNQ